MPQFLVIGVICMLAWVPQMNGFRVIGSVRTSNNTIRVAGFGDKKEIADAGRTITRVADAAAALSSYTENLLFTCL